MRAIVERLEAFATGGDADEPNVANVANDQPRVAATPDQPRVARVEIPKPQTIIRPEPPVKAAAPVAPAPAVQKADETPVQKPEAPHPKINKSGWKPFAKPLADVELSRRIDNELAALWQKNGIHPVEAATDAEFMRRPEAALLGWERRKFAARPARAKGAAEEIAIPF